MPRLMILIAFLAIVGLPGLAASQNPLASARSIPRMAEGEEMKPPGSFYLGGHSGSRDFVPFAVHYYEAQVGSELSHTWTPWALRLSGGDSENLTRQWVDGRTCPALYGVLNEFSLLATPRFRAPSFHSLPPGAGGMGGPGFTIGGSTVAVWGYARQADGGATGLMITGVDGLLPKWVDYAERALEPCWTTEAPVFEPAG
jgi:hypothetical protein